MSKTKSQLQADIAKFETLINKDTTSEGQKKVFRAIKSKAEAKLSSMDKEAPKKEEPKKEVPKPKAVAKKAEPKKAPAKKKSTAKKKTVAKKKTAKKKTVKKATANKSGNTGSFSKLRAEIAKREGITYKEALPIAKKEYADLKSKIKESKSSKANGRLNAFKKKYKGRGLESVQGKPLDIEKDAKLQALPKGKRISKGTGANQYGKAKKGKVYYEYRSNRTDVRQPKKGSTLKPPRLSYGGKITRTYDVNINSGVGTYADGGRINIVNEGEKFNKKKYRGALGDFDKDGVANIDDARPLINTGKKETVEQVELAKTFDKLLKLKSQLDSTMNVTVDELDEVAPKGAQIYARTKTPYSILNKLVEKRLLDKNKGLTDLVGTTIAVDNYKDLRAVDSKIRGGAIGKVVEIEDMYDAPKGGYRAVHYLVESDGYIIEVQLKTKRQKDVNVLSHNPYKKGTLNKQFLLDLTDLANRADKEDAKAIKEFSKLMKDKKAVEKKLDTSFEFGGEIARSYDVNINSGVGTYAKGGMTDINEDASNLPKELRDLFLDNYDDDRYGDYQYMEELRGKANQIGYDFDYDLSGTPTAFTKTMAKGGEVWVNELGDYNEVEGRKIAKAENEWYKESDQSELTAKYENGKVNVYLNESLAEDYAKGGELKKGDSVLALMRGTKADGHQIAIITSIDKADGVLRKTDNPQTLLAVYSEEEGLSDEIFAREIKDFAKGGQTIHQDFNDTTNYLGKEVSLVRVYDEDKMPYWDDDAQATIDFYKRQGKKAMVVHKGSNHGMYVEKSSFAKGGIVYDNVIEDIADNVLIGTQDGKVYRTTDVVDNNKYKVIQQIDLENTKTHYLNKGTKVMVLASLLQSDNRKGENRFKKQMAQGGDVDSSESNFSILRKIGEDSGENSDVYYAVQDVLVAYGDRPSEAKKEIEIVLNKYEMNIKDYAKGGTINSFTAKGFDDEKLIYNLVEQKNTNDSDYNYVIRVESNYREPFVMAQFNNKEDALEYLEIFKNRFPKDKIVYAKGGKTQGYNARLDESLGERTGAEIDFEQKKKDRRDESKAMEKAKGKRAYSSVRTMDKMAKGGTIEDNEGNSLSKGDKVVLITDDEEFLNPEDGIGNIAKRGDAFEVIRHLGASEGYDEDSNSIEMKHIKTGEVSSFAGFRVLKVNPQYAKGGEVNCPNCQTKFFAKGGRSKSRDDMFLSQEKHEQEYSKKRKKKVSYKKRK